MQKDNYIKYIQFYINLYDKGFRRCAKLLYWINRIVFSCDIPCTVRFGNNLRLPHFGLGVVIYPYAKIGNNVTIYQQVTIGAKNGPCNIEIGSNVMIGTGCKVLGDVSIGDHTKLGANSVVLHSTPPYSIIVGVPGHFVKRR